MAQRNSSFAALRRFARERRPGGRCEMCGAELSHDHCHMIGAASRKMICVCDPCAILFGHAGNQPASQPIRLPGDREDRYWRVPRRIRLLADFRLTDAQWENLSIPINLAFFFRQSSTGRIVALYPSPAGPTESLLTFESWEAIVQENPVLKEMEADVEALLVNRVGGALNRVGHEYYLVPIDHCYKLVGLIRAYWRGFSGGAEVWEEIRRFFDKLRGEERA